MFVSQAHSFTQQARLAITLAWVAGYTNILTILTCGTATSHVTGTVAQLGRDVVEGRWGLTGFTTFILGTFLAGAMLSGFCTEYGRRRGWESIYVLPITIQGLMLTAFAVGIETHDVARFETGGRLFALVGLASVAMGLQNATITRISGGVVRTTHMTGVFTDLGIEFVQFLYWVRDRRAERPRMMSLVRSVQLHPSARRLGLLGSVAGSFALGAGLGALGFDRFPKWAMFPPVLFLLVIILQDIRSPICEIEASKEFKKGGENGVDLPAGIAVFHLRKDRTRRGRVQRLPDLVRWCERLPATTRVIVLDLAEVVELDDNAAMELRALVLLMRAKGRRMVIAGMTAEQYRVMQEAGAGDVLDAMNVCPDLELAVARAIVLMEDGER